MKKTNHNYAGGLLAAAALACCFFSAIPCEADSVVVFNEIQYHPATREAELEWVELHNQMAVDVDSSSSYLSDAVF